MLGRYYQLDWGKVRGRHLGEQRRNIMVQEEETREHHRGRKGPQKAGARASVHRKIEQLPCDHLEAWSAVSSKP